MARVVIVGAGVGGLAAAARLADLGHQVTVLEQAQVVGGLVGACSRAGFTFDTGPTVLTLPAVFRDLFRTTGRPLERELELVPVDPACHYRFAGGVEVDLPNASRSGALAALEEAIGHGSGSQWETLLRRGERMWSTRQRFVEATPTAVDMVRMAARPRDLRALKTGRTLRALGEQSLTDHRLRAILESYVEWADPRRAPAALAAIPYVEHTFGTWYVRGGMRRLAEAIRDRAALRGATVRTSTEVAEVLVSEGRASGVRLTDGRTVPADVVVANAHAARLYGRLVRARQAARARRGLARLSPRASTFSILLALRGHTSGVRHRTVLFPEDVDAELEALFGVEVQAVDDPTIRIDAPDDPALRPSADTEMLSVHVRAPRPGVGEAGTIDWTAGRLGESYADQVLAVLASRGLDVRGRLLWRVVRTPHDLERETGAPGGAIEGPAFTGPFSMRRRPPAHRSPVHGLFLVGSSTRPGGTLPMVGLSAAIVADLIGRA